MAPRLAPVLAFAVLLVPVAHGSPRASGCTLSALRVVDVRSSGAAGSIYTRVVVRDRDGACTIDGYARLRLVVRGRLKVVPLGRLVIPGAPSRPRLVRLRRGREASFVMRSTDVPASGTRCLHASGFAFALPGTSEWERVRAALVACSNGRLERTPFAAGRIRI
jgi:hypothetical protein